MLTFNNRTAIVTGGAQGIGKSICENLAIQKVNIVIIDMNLEKAEELAVELAEKFNIKTKAYKCDVSKFTEVESVFKNIITEFDTIDILVNNAGITRDNLLMRMKEDEWDSVININLKGAFNCIKFIMRKMMKTRWGRIINISSVIGLMGNIGQANYSASKAGLIGLTKSAAKELAARNITVNAIAPGFIETAMTEALPESERQKYLEYIPLKNFGSPKNIADTVLFLASEEAGYITGQVMVVDGGMTM